MNGLPHDLDAERAALGAMLLDNTRVTTVAEVVAGDDYYRPAHGGLHQAIVAMHVTGQQADPITLAGHLSADGGWPAGVDHSYLHTLGVARRFVITVAAAVQ